MRLHRRDGRWTDAAAATSDDHEVLRILTSHVFPLEAFVGAEVAQLRTFAIPSIARTLHRSGGYERDACRRVDDTKGILSAIARHGPGDPRGQEVIAHLNDIHGFFSISQDDLRVTLADLVIEPMHFARRFGWRAPTARECAAVYAVWREVGLQMHIERLPETYAGLVEWRRQYEAKALGWSSEGEAVARALLPVLEAFLPAPLRVRSEAVISWMIGDVQVSRAIGFRAPSRRLSLLLRGLARSWGSAHRRVDPWRAQSFWDTALYRSFPTYPEGCDPLRMGPESLLARLDRR